MGIPGLWPTDALRGVRLGVSISDSDDLGTLGLTRRHTELALAEIARAVLTSQGGIVYGGRIRPSGFTRFLIHEVQRYGTHPEALTLCLAASEHRKLEPGEMHSLDQQLGARGRVVCLDFDGTEVGHSASGKTPEADARRNGHPNRTGYTAMRRYTIEMSQARVVLGGRLDGFKGSMPGIVEETIYAIEAEQPLYVAAGFGGAAALVARTLGIDDLSWAPKGFPQQPEDERIDESLNRLQAAASDRRRHFGNCGFTRSQLRQLAASYRPAQIASLIVNGLSERFAATLP